MAKQDDSAGGGWGCVIKIQEQRADRLPSLKRPLTNNAARKLRQDGKSTS